MEKRIVKMDVFSADPRTRTLNMALDRPVQPGRIAPVVVPPDSRLLVSFSSLARCVQLDIEVEIEGGKARRANLAPRYIATQVAEAETSTVEFKQSIFYAPGETVPSGEQLKTIAQTIASFMNCQGGTLYLGVHDSGQVRQGIQDDLSLLGTRDAGIVVATSRFTDADHVYHGNVDSYGRKIHALVRAYLGGAAEAYLGDCVACEANGGRMYVKLEIKAAPDDVIVYYPAETRFGLVDAIFVRNGAAKKSLMGSDRDQFIRERTKRQVLANVRAVTAANPAALVDQVMAAINQAFAQGAVVTAGTEVRIEGAVALDDPHFDALGSPKGLVFDGTHVCDVKGWTGAYEALLIKLNELDVSKFDDLPDLDFFKKYFVRVQPRKKYRDCYLTKFGRASDIRAQRKGGKVYFTNTDYVVHRLLAHFGVESGRVALRGE